MKPSAQGSKNNDWSEQDQAFFGNNSDDANERKTSFTNSKTSSNEGRGQSFEKVKRKVAEQYSTFSFGKLKDTISSNTNKASSKFLGLTNYPGRKNPNGNQSQRISATRSNYGDREGGFNVTSSNNQNDRTKKRNQEYYDKQQQLKGPSSNSMTGKAIVRSLKNTVVSTVPLPCAYCNAIPMMYKCHPFWGPSKRICSSHDFNAIPKCLSCQTFQSKHQRFHEIGTSGSLLCSSCANTAILDNTAARYVFDEVLIFLQSYKLDMFNGAMQRIPINLCTPPEMKQKFNSFKSDNSADQYGICCWTETHSPAAAAVGLIGAAGAAAARGLQKIVRERNHNDDSFHHDNDENKSTTNSIRRNPLGGGRFVSISQIAALKGLPRLYLGNILAHEATHAWLALNPTRKQGVIGENVSFGVVRRLPTLVEEGTCQLVAHLYLDYILCNKSTTLTSDELTIIEYNMWCIENHGIFEYGEGYKQAEKSYNQILQSGGSLHDLLEYISMHKSFPPC